MYMYCIYKYIYGSHLRYVGFVRVCLCVFECAFQCVISNQLIKMLCILRSYASGVVRFMCFAIFI